MGSINKFSIDFDSELRLDIECLRQIYFLGAPSSNIIRTAVRTYINHQLEINPAKKIEFDALKARKLQEAAANAGDKVSFLPKRKRQPGKST